jgi:hypothetical protein
MKKANPVRRTRQRRKAEPRWAALGDDDLLETPLKALKVRIAGTWLEPSLAELNDELHAHNINVNVHGWISDEWFSSPNTAGIAFPFYLCHPRLMKLERKMMFEAEGGSDRDCMRILRHEAGHVVQHAFGLHRRRRWQALFGRASLPYPDHYRPDPTSKNYVQYLRRWYAQCHPDEDFAETFAVWLTPRSRWRTRYADWPALEKLEYVDTLMSELGGEKPLPRKRLQIDPLSQLKGTLGEHYEKKRERYAVDTPTVFDRDLQRIFSSETRYRRAPLATAVIRRNRAQIRRSVARWTGEYPVALDHAIDDMIDRCRALSLRAPAADRETRLEITAMLASKAVHSLYSASRRQLFAV